MRSCGSAKDGKATVSWRSRLDESPVPDHDLTVIIPAYNEESRLPGTLVELAKFLTTWGIDYRVIIADDYSTDRTHELAEGFGPRFSSAVLDRHRGKGAAVRNAMLQATGRVVGFTDADLPYELTALREGYARIAANQCEVIFGARDLQRSEHHARRRISRSIATFVFRQVVRRLISRQVTDTQCGLKLFSLAAARNIFSRTTLDGFSFDAEVVLLTERLGHSYQRLPVNLINEYASTLSLARDTLPMLLDIGGLWFRSRTRSDFGRPLVVPAPRLPASEPQRRAA